MGIPGFFLWLQRHYTKAIKDVKPPKAGVVPVVPGAVPVDAVVGEDPDANADVALETPEMSNVDTTDDNPAHPPAPAPPPQPEAEDSGRGRGGGRGGRGGGRGGRGRGQFPRLDTIDHVACDNLYLDMNGLIHPCCHDTAPIPEPENEEEMLDRIFVAVDKLVALVKPKKVLFLAVDGVAPRSKMNQQRARRFRAAAERQEANEIARRMADVVVEAHQLPRPKAGEKWDHNVITPATIFMDRVGAALEWYIVKRLNDGDDDWKDLTVIFSDAHVPGEGEHKIMAYIRALRIQPGYNPNTRHVIHGQDADLIMLGLSTHEAHFTVLRNTLSEENFQPLPDAYCVFDLAVFRDMLERDMGALSGHTEFERVIDDFIFLCFLIGNDFLPHMPLVDIKCKGIETVLDHYVRYFSTYGYLTDGEGAINFVTLQQFLSSFVQARLHELVRLKDGALIRIERANNRMVSTVQENREKISSALAGVSANDSEESTAGVAKTILKHYIDIAREQLRLVAGKHPLPFVYGEGNYRDEYYRARFGWNYLDASTGVESAASRALFEEGVKRCVHEYLRGMQWVLWYYTKGCPSWEWFYPYHYAPLLQDVGRYGKGAPIDMALGEPLHPVEQLIAVLPRESVHALPPELHKDVLDQRSVLAKFYPKEMNVDFSEAIHSWQGTTLLPFVNCKRLQKAVREVVTLDADDGWALVFAREETATAAALAKYLDGAVEEKRAKLKTTKDADSNELPDAERPVFVPVPAEVAKVMPLAGEMGPFRHAWPRGKGLHCPDSEYAEAYPYGVASHVTDNRVVTYQYTVPAIAPYTCGMLPGAKREKSVFGPGSAGVKRAFEGRGSGSFGDRGRGRGGGGRGDGGGHRGGGGGHRGEGQYNNSNNGSHHQHHHHQQQQHHHHHRGGRGAAGGVRGGAGGAPHSQPPVPVRVAAPAAPVPLPPVPAGVLQNLRRGGGGGNQRVVAAPPPPPPVSGGNAKGGSARSASGQPAARRGPRGEGRR